MDMLKEAFSKVKQDIFNLQSQLNLIQQEIEEIKRTLSQQTNQQTDRQINTTHPSIPTHNLPLETPKYPNNPLSIGNEGVPTDRQTNQQTDRHTQKFVQDEKNKERNKEENKIDHIEQVSKIIESLDNLKKDIRHSIKKLTPQEMAVFSSIYELENEGFIVDYSLLSQKFGLTESSIRDYTLRIIKKGIPLEKIKENNKKIILKIPNTLKKVASLQTLAQLRAL